jgi:hypothetical protein
MRFSRDGAVAHSTRRESFYYFPNGFDFVKRDRACVGGNELEESAERGELLGMVVYELGVFLENLVLAGSGGVLQFVHGFGVEDVIFTLSSPLVFAAGPEIAMRYLSRVL